MTRRERAAIRYGLPADDLAALRALIDILGRSPAAVAAFFAVKTHRPKRAPAQLARKLRNHRRRLRTEMRHTGRADTASTAGLEDSV